MRGPAPSRHPSGGTPAPAHPAAPLSDECEYGAYNANERGLWEGGLDRSEGGVPV